MGTRRCCCGPTSCLIGTDDFNRADANPPTGDWEVISGEWEIVGNKLECVTEGPILTTIRQGGPTSPGVGYHTRVTVSLVNYTYSGGGPWGIISAYTDANNFKWIKLEIIDFKLWPTFYNRAGGVDTVVADKTTHPGGEPWSPSPFAPFGMVFCNSDAEWVAQSGSTYWSFCDGGLSSLPADTSLGCVGFLFGDFDNWAFYYHWESKRICDQCTCFCFVNNSDYKCMPDTICIEVIPDTEYECPEMDFRTATLFKVKPDTTIPESPIFDDSPEVEFWYSMPFTISELKLWWILACGPTGTVSLQLIGYPTLAIPGNYFDIVSPDSCDPFVATFYGLISVGTTCDLGGSTGTKPLFCPGGVCTDGSFSISWTVVATEC